MKVATFYHIGCPVSQDAEKKIISALDPKQYRIECVDLGKEKLRVSEAKEAGVKSVPALVINGAPFHINYSVSIDALYRMTFCVLR